MNVGQIVDRVLGLEDNDIIDADAEVMVTLEDGTMISLSAIEYEASTQTLWLRGNNF